MITVANEKIEKLFESYDIFDDDSNEIDELLSQYDCEVVIKCLLEKLKSISSSEDNIEPAWRLGRVFASISERYSADKRMYSFLDSCKELEKIALLNFLSGYWDGTKSDLNVVVDLSNSVANSISNASKYSEKLFFYEIDAVVTGYSSYRYRAKIDIEVESIFKEKLRLFATYLSGIPANTVDVSQTLEFIEKLVNSTYE
jgi:hypothetical protein